MLKKTVYLLSLMLLFQCSKKDEDVIVCSPTPSYKDINIVDKVSGENVFSNGRFTRSQLQIITDPVNLFPVAFRDNKVFTINPLEKVGVVNFSLVLNNEITIPLTTNIFLSDDGICGKRNRFKSFTSSDSQILIIENFNSIEIKI